MSDISWDRLAEPFPADEVKVKPQSIKGDRAMVVHYIDARCVMDRLDSIVGPGNWQDNYREIGTAGAVECKLSIKVGDEWITKTDVGGESEQPDDGDKVKAAYSDALKRAAVKWGIGRYLYSLPRSWCNYDPAKRVLSGVPALPAWALPPVVNKVARTWDEITRKTAAADARIAAKGIAKAGDFKTHVRAIIQEEIDQELLSKNIANWTEAQYRGVLGAIEVQEADFKTPELSGVPS